VPRTPCCQQPGKVCANDASTWRGEPWAGLSFGLFPARHFQWRYRNLSQGADQTVVIEARGDLDCDGEYSNDKMIVHGLPGARPRFSEVLERNPLE